MKNDDHRQPIKLLLHPATKPPKKGWSPFKKLGILRLKYKPPKKKKEEEPKDKKGDVKHPSNCGNNVKDKADAEAYEILDISREAVEEYNRTTRTRDPRRRLSRTISCQSINKRPQAPPSPSRTKQFNASTPNLLNLRRANIPETVEEVDDDDESDTDSDDGSDPFKFDNFLSQIMEKFPLPPDEDNDRTIRARKPREIPRLRAGSIASSSTATTSTHCSTRSSSKWSTSTGETSVLSHSRHTSTTSYCSNASTSTTGTTQPLRVKVRTTSNPMQPVTNSVPFPKPPIRANTTPQPLLHGSPADYCQYSDANPPPVPPKDRKFKKTSISSTLSWGPEKETVSLPVPAQTYLIGCEMMGEGVNNDDTKGLQRSASEQVKVKSGGNLILNRKPRMLRKQNVDVSSVKTQLLPPMRDTEGSCATRRESIPATTAKPHGLPSRTHMHT